jgi:DNA-binding XRE family transcriptional regulator
MAQKAKELNVGQRVSAWRRQRGLAQGVVSRRAGIDPSYLSRIETGKVHPTVRTAMRIAGALRVSLNDLLGPSPASGKDHPCPVSVSGRCVMDLIDTGSQYGRVSSGERYTPRQLRLLRRFTVLLQRSNPNLQKALEVLVGEILEDGKKRS